MAVLRPETQIHCSPEYPVIRPAYRIGGHLIGLKGKVLEVIYRSYKKIQLSNYIELDSAILTTIEGHQYRK